MSTRRHFVSAVGMVLFTAAETLLQHRVATIGVPVRADSGVLMAYGHDAEAMFKRGAVLVDRILKSA